MNLSIDTIIIANVLQCEINGLIAESSSADNLGLPLLAGRLRQSATALSIVERLLRNGKQDTGSIAVSDEDDGVDLGELAEQEWYWAAVRG